MVSNSSESVLSPLELLESLLELLEDESESDRLGVRFMLEAGYDPQAMIRVMEILAESNQGSQPPEFFSTHPDPANRIEKIKQAIDIELAKREEALRN